MSWIITHTAQRFELLQPTAAMIHPADIAHSLAHLCRFNGHTHEHYSVAQHCYIASTLVPKEDALAALLHDAPEAYIGDMTRPLKQVMPAFKALEASIWAAICARFDLATELPTSVQHIDMVMLGIERRDLMPAHPDEWECLGGIELPAAHIRPWSAIEARTHYFNRLMELMATTHRANAA